MKKALHFTAAKSQWLFILMIFVALSGHGQGHETFDNHSLSGTIYVDGSFVGNDGITWNYVHVTGEQVFPIDGKGIILRRSAIPSAVYSDLIPGGIGDFSVQLRKAFTSAGDRQVELFVNGVSKGTSLTFGGASGADDTVHDFVVSNINIPGDIVIEVRHITGGSNNRQLTIDNIVWTGFGDGSNLPPAISNIVQTPAADITSSATVSVSADVTAAEGTVELVELRWGTALGEYPNTILMTSAGGDTYTTVSDIPAQADKTTVYYVIYAEDDEGASSTSTVKSYTVFDPAIHVLPYSEHFEGFISAETLPDDWFLSNTTYGGDWGTGVGAGLRGNANVLGFQHTAATGLFTASLTLVNNTGATLEELYVAYKGMVERVGEGRSPEWTVRLNGSVVEELFYSTVDGINKDIFTQITGLSIAENEAFTISWSSERGEESGASKQIGISNVYIGTEEMPPTVAAPGFSPTGGIFFNPVAVTIATTTEDATIQYSTDSADGPWTSYSGTPITVEESTTIWAYATAEDFSDSPVSQATYTFPEIIEVATLAALRDMDVDDTYYIYTGEAVIVAMDDFRNRKFIQDETAAILIDDQPNVITTAYALYDVVTDVVGKLDLFHNMLRFQPALNTEPATQNTPVSPALYALDDVTPVDQARLLQFEEVSFSGVAPGQVFANGTNYTITDGDVTFILRTDFWNVDYIGTEIPDTPVNVNGVIVQYQDDLQIIPRFQGDIELLEIPDEPGNIMLSSSNLASFREVYAGNFSDVQFYYVEATDIESDLTIHAPAPFKVSFDCTEGFSESLVLEEAAGSIDETKIFVRAYPTSAGSFGNNIVHESGLIAKNLGVSVTGTISQIPSGYYSTATGTGEALMAALHSIITDHTVLGYESIWGHFESTDATFNGKVWDVFSYKECEEPPYTYTFFVDQQTGETVPDEEGHVYNREHLWPQSWWSGSDPLPMVTDIHHVYPADRWVNMRKSNYPFGEITAPTWTSEAGNMIGNNSFGSTYSGMVFEPVDELKGDFARTYFYMATRYMDQLPAWSTNAMAEIVLNGTVFPGFEPWFIELLLTWHANDPVSQKEIERNNAIYDLQNNRNPFIDHPEFAALIWGDVPQIPSGELCNLDFELWFNTLPYCWYGSKSNIGQANVNRYDENPHSGDYAVQLINPGETHQRFTTHAVTVEAETVYTITFWVKGAGEVRTGLFDDRGTGFGYAPYNDYIEVSGDSWSEHAQTITAFNTTDIAEFVFSVRNTDASGDHIQLDHVSITGMLPPPVPLLDTDPATLSGLSYFIGEGPSEEQGFLLSGENLDGSDVVITAPDGFEISQYGMAFGGMVTLSAYDGMSAEIFVRLQAGLAAGSYSGQADIAGGGADATMVQVNGTVSAPTEPFSIPYFNAFRTTQDNDTAEEQGFVISNAQNEQGAGGYLRIFPDGYLETPAIDFGLYDHLAFFFDATTYGGSLGQTLSLKITSDGGVNYDVISSWTIAGSYVTYETLIDLTGFAKSANANIKVEMTGGGGSSRLRDLYIQASVAPVPDDLNIADEGDVVIHDMQCFFALGSIYVAGAQYAFSVVQGGEVILAAGEQISLLPGTKVYSGGYLHAFISHDDPCMRPFVIAEESKEQEVITGTEAVVHEAAGLAIKLYPNPTWGEFNLEVVAQPDDSDLYLEVFSQIGDRVLNKVLPADRLHTFNLDNYPAGIYLVRVAQGTNVSVERLIVR